MKALTVVQPFGDHQRGAQITDSAQIEEILASEQANKVVPVELPDATDEHASGDDASQ